MGIDDLCHTGLVLGLGLSSSPSPRENKSKTKVKISHEPSLTLSLSGSETLGHEVLHHHHPDQLYGQDHSGASSSLAVSSVKREREMEEVEIERVTSSRVSDEDDDGGGPNVRKKLRLTKAQSALLEESFKHHTTLNPKQKQELARELKLRPRQVEVWFQNRRARTKLKQTEVDCELLKQCCDSLTDENRRLQKELHELKALKLAKPLYMAATLTMCPSCERVAGAVPEKAAKAAFAMAPKPHLYNPFANQSAAC